jgi:polar amino acid transport system substrate-binding protein
MSKEKKLAGLAGPVLIAIGLLLTGCATKDSGNGVAADPSILRVGVCANSPPMIFKEGDQLTGAEVDLAEALGKDLGRRVVFVQESWENLIDALCANKFDVIMSSMSITPARSYQIAFSDPYLRVGQMALARGSEKYKYLMSLAGQAKNGVGVKPGTTADFLLRQEYPTAKRKYYTTGEEAANALLREKVDLFVSDAPLIWYLTSKYESKGLATTPLILSQEQLGWGIRRADTALRENANAFLKKAQSSGEMNRILGRWMPGFQ